MGCCFREDEVDVRFADEAVRWLHGVPADQPFLCYLAPSAPHRPVVPPTSHRAALAEDPANQRWQQRMSAYVARFAENPQGAAGMGLRHVWTLSEQVGE